MRFGTFCFKTQHRRNVGSQSFGTTSESNMVFTDFLVDFPIESQILSDSLHVKMRCRCSGVLQGSLPFWRAPGAQVDVATSGVFLMDVPEVKEELGGLLKP